MQANELRVGNWINEEWNNVRQWRSEDYANYHGPDYPENEISDKIEPIDLTPEILEQCGFEKKYGTFSLKEFSYCEILDNYGDYHLSCEGCIGSIKITYLHQLQNLFFALAGEELEIK